MKLKLIPYLVVTVFMVILAGGGLVQAIQSYKIYGWNSYLEQSIYNSSVAFKLLIFFLLALNAFLLIYDILNICDEKKSLTA